MSRDVTLLHPRLQGIVYQMQSEFPNMLVTETYRTVAEQNALYAKGRTTAGPIVTYVTGSSYGSQHQWGVAFDVVKQNTDGSIDYNDNVFWNKIGARAKQLGCAWGGDWTGFVDKPHIYLPDWGSTTSVLKSTYGTFDNFKNTWGDNPPKKEDDKVDDFLIEQPGNPMMWVQPNRGKITPMESIDEVNAINDARKAVGLNELVTIKGDNEKANYIVRWTNILSRVGI